MKKFKCEFAEMGYKGPSYLNVYCDSVIGSSFIILGMDEDEDNCIWLNKEKAEKLVKRLNKLIEKL